MVPSISRPIPISTRLTWALILSLSKSHFPDLLPKHWTHISFDIWPTFKIFSYLFSLSPCLLLFLLPFFSPFSPTPPLYFSPLILSFFLPFFFSLGKKKKKKSFCLFLRTKVGQGHHCPRNMLRLIQFARACRSCKYLWETEKKLTQANKVKGLGRGMAKHQWPQVSLHGCQMQLATSASLWGGKMGKQEEGGKSVLGIRSNRSILSPFPLTPAHFYLPVCWRF